MQLPFKTPDLTSRSYKQIGWLLLIIVLTVVVLIVVWLTPVELAHVGLALGGFAAGFVIIYGRRKRLWQRFKIKWSKLFARKVKAAPARPSYYAREQLSRVTIEHSGLSDRELEKVLYDEHHHWTITIVMVLNPFWSRDHDLRARAPKDFEIAQSGTGNKSLLRTIRIFTRLAQVFYAIGCAVLVGVMSLSYFDLLPMGSPFTGLRMTLLSAGMIVATMIWVPYMVRVAHGCRLVITEWSIIFLVHQLPWRDNSIQVVQYQNYASSTPQQSPSGWILRFIDLAISTLDPDEPMSGWIKASDFKRLMRVMAYWDLRKRTEQERKYAEMSRPTPTIGLKDTREIPVVPA